MNQFVEIFQVVEKVPGKPVRTRPYIVNVSEIIHVTLEKEGTVILTHDLPKSGMDRDRKLIHILVANSYEDLRRELTGKMITDPKTTPIKQGPKILNIN